MTHHKKIEIKTGVIGVGSMGINHARVYSEISNLVAVSDPNEEQGRMVAERFGIKYYSDYQSMLPHIEAVSVVVPTFLHRKVSEIVADAGVHLLVEKPLAHTSLDAEKIIAVSAKNNVVLAVGHIERFNGVVKHAKKNVTSGSWGDIISLSANRFSNYPSRIHDVGVLFDLTIHDVDILRFFADSEVISVNAIGGKFKNSKHEDFVSLSMNFEDGKIGLCQTNWLTPMKVRELNLITDNCFVNLNYLNQEIKQLKTKYGKIDNSNLYNSNMEVIESKIQLKSEEPLKTELLDFLESVYLKKSPLVTGEEGLNAVRIVEAGLLSLNENKVIVIK